MIKKLIIILCTFLILILIGFLIDQIKNKK